jgi:hypothetical protein
MHLSLRQAAKLAYVYLRHSLITLAAGMALIGLVTFPLFIMEEATQMVVFGTWQASSAKDWHTLNRGIDLAERINAHTKHVNRLLGWIHPLNRLSYQDFTAATDYWIESNRVKILALDPHAMGGRRLTLSFTPDSMTDMGDHWTLKAGLITVIVPDKPLSIPVSVSGIVRPLPSGVIIDTRPE